MTKITKIAGFLMVMALIFSSIGLFAQQTQRSPEERAKLRSEKMTEKLSLNETQKQQVYDIMLEHATQKDAIKNNQDITKESRKEQMKALRESTDQKLTGIFSKEQIDKWNTMKKNMKEKHGKKNGHGKKHGKHKGNKNKVGNVN